MRAARFHAARDVRLEDVPVPEPGAGEALVRVRAVSICPSDWRMYVDGHAGGVVPDRPIIQGHEFAGDVAALGPGTAGPRVGARVAVEPSWSCGSCDMCRNGKGNICRSVRFPSFPPVDGALAEYIACPAHALCELPAGVSYEAGALTEPIGVALHAVRLARVRTGEGACILGAGVIGLAALSLCRSAGADPITVVEPVAERSALAGSSGADAVARSHAELLAAGFEADVVMECSGDHEGLDQCVGLAGPGGRVVVVGIPRDERITFDMAVARRRELAVTFCRRSHNALAEAVRLVASNEINVGLLPLRRFQLGETRDALELTGRPGGVLRAVVYP